MECMGTMFIGVWKNRTTETHKKGKLRFEVVLMTCLHKYYDRNKLCRFLFPVEVAKLFTWYQKVTTNKKSR